MLAGGSQPALYGSELAPPPAKPAGAVSIGGDVSEAFNIRHRVKQGCACATALFKAYALPLETLATNMTSGVYIRTRTEESCSITPCLRYTQKQEVCVRDLLYADDLDSALIAVDPGKSKLLLTISPQLPPVLG